MEYHIRAMQEQDIPFVSQIENQIFSLPWSEKSFRDAAANPDNVYLVCECTGEIAGYCGMLRFILPTEERVSPRHFLKKWKRRLKRRMLLYSF